MKKTLLCAVLAMLPQAISAQESASFKLNEQIIRYLTVHFDSKTLRLEEEQVRRNEAALESRNATGPRSRGDDDDDRVPSPRASAEA